MQTQRIMLLIIILLSGVLSAHATHNRAGEIIYCHLGGLSYEVTIITHTKTSSPADRQFLVIDWGDNTSDTLQRDNQPTLFPPLDAQENRYTGIHQYLGPGIYTLSFIDPNRNAGVLNIPNSVQEPFCVQSQLIIAPQTVSNCSVRFLNSPLQDACSQEPWIHNSVAFDPDGDSLSYQMVTCRGLNCQPIAGYTFPDQVGTIANSFSIDPITGTIFWIDPQLTGEYNIAFQVSEWRNGQLVGWVVRDMQINVVPCPTNTAPIISSVADTCIVANSQLNVSITASDPNTNDDLTMVAQGEPFTGTGQATFIAPSPGNPVSGNFVWTPDCDRVRLQPYQVVFEVTDDAVNPNIPLTNVSTFSVTVIAPPVQNPVATPVVSSIQLTWDPSVCSNATGYKVYRRIDTVGYNPSHCETGVPASTGYVLIGTTQGLLNSNYLDNGPLAYGQNYCYMIVACFADGSQSIASEEFCTSLNREAPVLTNVTVDVTDPSTGQITVRWENALELDTVQFPGPYNFELRRSIAGNNSFNTINTSPPFPFLLHPDTSFVDGNIDTQNSGYTYVVELHNANGLVSTSSEASSLFLTPLPGDEKADLTWTNDVPWINNSFDVYRETSPNNFTLIATTTSNSYTDSSLVNGQQYCYYIESTGTYSLPNITTPLINLSQISCATPIDLTPPCPPDLSILNECELPLNTLTWNDPNNSCSADNAGYNVYFSPFADSTLQFLAFVDHPSDTVFLHVNGVSVSGCYAVTAIDSSGNESAFSNIVCGENCPVYDLPNVFTPNGDGLNDTFRPLDPYRGVDKIDLKVFNRWGQLVYQTEDAAIAWNGDHATSGVQLSDGVYFYTCDVYFPNLTGIEIIELTGSITILQNRGNTNN